MKIRPKIIIVFLAGYAIGIPLLLYILSNGMFQVADGQMKKQAETFGLLLKNRIVDISKDKINPQLFTKEVSEEFRKFQKITNETQSFEVDKIILIDKNFLVQVGLPQDAAGVNYRGHDDVNDSFKNKSFEVALEKEISKTGEEETDIDVVTYLEIADSSAYVLEIKLNFEKTVKIVKEQYRKIQFCTMGLIILILGLIQAGLLYLLTRAVIRPIHKISAAMEQVGTGDFNVQVNHKVGKDEFGMMVRQFNGMVVGLKERGFLTQYVSQATMNQVREKSRVEENVNKPERVKATIFFSDIRKFTTYSENRDPAQVIETLNIILDIQAKIIQEHKGDIDKFVGDETMAVFTNPQQAIEAAIAIQKEMFKQSHRVDNLQVGIGVYEGFVVRGDVGSSHIKNYTVIGDVVNTAARLQANALGGEIIISEAVALEDDNAKKYGFTKKGDLKLKGKSGEFSAYSILINQ